MIKNIIFDFDGVLVDSEILVAKAFAKYMQNFGITMNDREFANYAGSKTVQTIELLSEKYSIKNQQKFFDDIMDIASNIYKNELTKKNIKFIDLTSYKIIDNKRLSGFFKSRFAYILLFICLLYTSDAADE